MNRLMIMYGLVVVLLLGGFCGVNMATADVRVAWDANTEDDLAGYKIYYGFVADTYPNRVDVMNVTEKVIGGLQDSTNYVFVVTAYDTAGNESEYSDPVMIFYVAEYVLNVDMTGPAKVKGVAVSIIKIALDFLKQLIK